MFKQPLPPSGLTGKNGVSRKSSVYDFSNPNNNVANKGGGFRKSSGSDQDGFSSQNQTVAPSCTDADSDTASDSDTAILAAVMKVMKSKPELTERSSGHVAKGTLVCSTSLSLVGPKERY